MKDARMGSLEATAQFKARVDTASQSLRQTIRYARANAPRGGEPWVHVLAADIINIDPAKRHSLEHVTAFVLDLAQRGDLQGAEMIGRELIAQARLEYERCYPQKASEPLPVVHLAEEHAEGLAEEAETILAHEPTRMNAERYLQAASVHATARDRLDMAVRRLVGTP